LQARLGLRIARYEDEEPARQRFAAQRGIDADAEGRTGAVTGGGRPREGPRRE
jgi:hypothetical protein